MGSKTVRKKPVVKFADSRYQPTEAEMEEDISIDAAVVAGSRYGCGVEGC